MIPAGDSYKLVISFAPTSEASYTDILTITSDAPGYEISEISLMGEGVHNPQILLSTENISVSLENGETQTEILTITNVQGVALEYEITLEEVSARDLVSGSFENAPTGNMGMVWADGDLFVVGSDDDKLYKYDILTESIIDEFAIHSNPFGIAFDGTYFWIGSSNGYFYKYDIDGNEISQFYNSSFSYPSMSWDGNNLLVAVSTNSNPQIVRLDAAGNTTDVYATSFGGKANQLVWVDSHLEGHLWAIDFAAQKIRQFRLEDGSSSVIKIIDYDEFSTVSYGLAHNGKDLWIAENETGNIYRIDDEIDEFNWLSVNPISGSVTTSTQIEINFDARTLFAGSYFANINIESNDPINPTKTISAELVVSGNSEIQVSVDSLAFEEIFAGADLTLPLEIGNAGSAPLIISNITSSQNAFSVNETNFEILPLETYELEVVFSPSVSGSFAGNITIYSNDANSPSIQILLSGSATGEPQIIVSPASITTNLNVGETENHSIDITNTGYSNLTYSVYLNESQERSFVNTDRSSTPYGLYADESRSNSNSMPNTEIEMNVSDRFIGDFINSYSNLPTYNAGMLWIEDELFVVDFNEASEGQPNGLLTKFDLETETVIAEYPIHNTPYGIAFDGNYIWIGNQSGNIYAYDPATLNTTSNLFVYSFSSPVSDFNAMTFDGQYFIMNQAFSDYNANIPFYRIDVD